MRWSSLNCYPTAPRGAGLPWACALVVACAGDAQEVAATRGDNEKARDGADSMGSDESDTDDDEVASRRPKGEDETDKKSSADATAETEPEDGIDDSEAEDDTDVTGSGDATNRTDEDGGILLPPTPGSTEFLIPLEPVYDGYVAFGIEEDPESGEFVTTNESTLRLGVGKGYPDTMLVTPTSLLLHSGDAVRLASEMVVTSANVVGGGPGLDVAIEGSDQVQIFVEGPGTFVVALELQVTFEDDAEPRTLALPGLFRVEAKQVTGAEWSTCSTEPLYVASGSRFASSRLYAIDEAGVIFSPDNAAFDRGADLILTASEDTVVDAPDGIDTLVITGPSQTVSVTSPYGPVATLELIQPEEIDALTPTFQSSQGGPRGGGVGVSSGGEHAVEFAEEPYISVYPGATYQGNHVCAQPEPELFQLRTETPEVCSIDADGCKTRGCYTPAYVPAVANLLRAGTCILELDAPSLNDGNGLSTRFELDVQEL